MDKNSIKEAIKKLKESSKKRNFKQTFDLIINLRGLDLKKSEEQVNLHVPLHYPKGKPIKGFTDYATALFGSVMQVQNSQHLHSDDWQRTIYIDTKDVGTTEFDLTDKDKANLVQSGKDCATKYFEWFKKEQKKIPINRIP